MSDYENEEWLGYHEEEADANCSCEWDWDNPVSRCEPRFVQCDWCRWQDDAEEAAREEYNAATLAKIEEERRQIEAHSASMWLARIQEEHVLLANAQAAWEKAEQKRVADARAANPYYDITVELQELTRRSSTEHDLDKRIAACGELFERLCKPDGADFMAAHPKFRAIAAAKAAEFRHDENGARLLEVLDRFDALFPTLCENSHWKESA